MPTITNCMLCPRHCGADRTKAQGFCGGGDQVRVARAALHQWEEPCISGTDGSGTVFFSGCPLQCCFCQNFTLSAQNSGKEISVTRLAAIFLELQEQHAHNINLVNPTHYLPWIIEALALVKGKLTIPVVYNSGGYETVESLRMAQGYISIYLPDFKFVDPQMSAEYSGAADYFSVASKAILEMYRQVGGLEVDSQGILQRGLIVRHLVMPGGRHDSMRVLDWLAQNLPLDKIELSLMSQYTPFYRSCEHPKINRRITSFEYDSVMRKAQEYGFQGFMQEKSSAKEEYTPIFDGTGV